MLYAIVNFPVITVFFICLGCQDFSNELIKNGTTLIEGTCGMFKHLPAHDSTSFEYRIRLSVKEGVYIKVVLLPPSMFEDIIFMCKNMKHCCKEDLKVRINEILNSITILLEC